MSRLVFIQKLELYDLKLSENYATAPINERFEKVPSDEFFDHEAYRYPLILNDNGSIWRDGNLYLLDFYKCVRTPNFRTLESIARDLRGFWDWCLEENIAYLSTEGRRLTLAPARYNRHLSDKIEQGKLSSSTAIRQMINVQNFYRWLKQCHRVPDVKFWIEGNTYSNNGNQRGTTDLVRALKRAKVLESDPNTIVDGGNLRPLTKVEQTALLGALKKIGNIEMTLAFQLALTTGARSQSVFTMRANNFLRPLNSTDAFIIQKIGGNTKVDNKYNVEVALPIPAWLYQSIQLYIRGTKRKKRVLLSKHVYKDQGDEYAFLTSRGNAFYLSKHDKNRTNYKKDPPRGGSMRSFITNQLIPELQKNGFHFKFSFHDLRATYGVNLVNSLTKSLSKEGLLHEGSAEFLHVLEFVKNRLGHRSIKTTLNYLRFKSDRNLLLESQEAFEDYQRAGIY